MEKNVLIITIIAIVSVMTNLILILKIRSMRRNVKRNVQYFVNEKVNEVLTTIIKDGIDKDIIKAKDFDDYMKKIIEEEN